MPLPVVFGHEGAGVVERVGAGVTKVKPGDHVVLSFDSCGHCRNCNEGKLGYCLDLYGYNFSGGRPDGSTGLSQNGVPVHGHFFFTRVRSRPTRWPRRATR